MTDAVAIALTVAVPPTLVALAGLIQSILNGKKADQIHVLVNSNMDALKSDLQNATAAVADLTRRLAVSEEDRRP